MDTRSIPTKEVAALIRGDLRAAFPGVKFSVRCSRGTASAWIGVHWTDGPTATQVDEITHRYQGRSFDGITDTYTDLGTSLIARDGGQMPENVMYHCDGVNAHRELSPAAALLAQQIIRDDSNVPELIICDDDGTLRRGAIIGPDRAESVVIGGDRFNFPTLDAHLAMWHAVGGRDLTPARNC